MRWPQLRAVALIWAVRQLTAYSIGLRATSLLRFLAVGWAVGLLVAFAAGDFGVALTSYLLTSSPPESADHRAVTSSLLLVVVMAVAYLLAADIGRMLVTSARDVVGRSPSRGLWLALDVSVLEAVVVECGTWIVARSALTSAFAAGAFNYARRIDAGPVPEAIGALASVEFAYLGLASGVALLNAGRFGRRRLPRFAVPVIALGGLPAGWFAGALIEAVVPDSRAIRSVVRSPDLAAWWGFVDLAAGVALVGAIAVLVLAWPALDSHPLALTQAPRPGPGTRSLWRGHWEGSGVGRVTTSADLTVAIAWLLALAAVGWRIGGGPLVPAGSALIRAALATTGLSVFVMTGALSTVSGHQTHLWRLRFWTDLGVGPLRVVLASMAPVVLPAALVGVACTVMLAGLAGTVDLRPLTLCLGIALAVTGADSFTARPLPDAADGAGEASATQLVLTTVLALPLVAFALIGGAATGVVLALAVIALAGFALAAGRWRLLRLPVRGAAT